MFFLDPDRVYVMQQNSTHISRNWKVSLIGVGAKCRIINIGAAGSLSLAQAGTTHRFTRIGVARQVGWAE